MGGAKPNQADVFIYFWYTILSINKLCVLKIKIYGLSTLLGGWSSIFIRRIVYKFWIYMSCWLHSFCGNCKGLDPVNRFNHISVLAVVTPTDRPKSVCNRCVIEYFGGVFVLALYIMEFPVGVRAFVIGLSQIISFSLNLIRLFPLIQPLPFSLDLVKLILHLTRCLAMLTFLDVLGRALIYFTLIPEVLLVSLITAYILGLSLKNNWPTNNPFI